MDCSVTYKNNTRYYKFDNVPNLPSVTSIIKAGKNDNFLEEWKKRVGEEEAERISLHGRNRGNVMHKLTEVFLEHRHLNLKPQKLYTDFMNWSEFKDYIPETIDSGKQLFEQLFESKLFNEIKNIVGIETALYYWDGKIGYAGRSDLIFENHSNEIIITDLKSSTKNKKSEWIFDYYKQAAAYSIAYWRLYGVYPSAKIWISCETGKVQEFKLNKSEINWFHKRFMEDVYSFYNK